MTSCSYKCYLNYDFNKIRENWCQHSTMKGEPSAFAKVGRICDQSRFSKCYILVIPTKVKWDISQRVPGSDVRNPAALQIHTRM